MVREPETDASATATLKLEAGAVMRWRQSLICSEAVILFRDLC